jgi:hypothetical protein
MDGRRPDWELEEVDKVDADLAPWDDEDDEPPSLLEQARNFLSELLAHYPLLFWSGIWTLVLLVAGLAVTGLMNPKLSKQDDRPNHPANVSGVTGRPDQEGFPLWMVGAIALSCAAGTMLISNRLKHAQRLENLPEPLDLDEIYGDPQPQLFAHPLPRALLRASETTPEVLETASLKRFIEPPPEPPAPTPGEESQVTIVPTWERTPLDYRAPGLAEILEIRQRRSNKRPGKKNS